MVGDERKKQTGKAGGQVRRWELPARGCLGSHTSSVPLSKSVARQCSWCQISLPALSRRAFFNLEMQLTRVDWPPLLSEACGWPDTPCPPRTCYLFLGVHRAHRPCVALLLSAAGDMGMRPSLSLNYSSAGEMLILPHQLRDGSRFISCKPRM